MQARVLYHHEIDELVNQGGVEASSMIERLAATFPSAPISQILYTATEHIRTKGLNSDEPGELLEIPCVEESDRDTEAYGDEERTEHEADTEVEAKDEPSTQIPLSGSAPILSLDDPEQEAIAASNEEIREQIRLRREQRRARRSSLQQMSRDVNVRDLMADIESLEL